MFPVFETIKVYQGNIHNLELHSQRMLVTAKSLWNASIKLKHLTTDILALHNGNLQKCQIKYNQVNTEINLVDYTPRTITKLLLHKDDQIDYHFKFTDRQKLLGPLKDRRPDVDVLFVKNGLLSDSSFSNIALWNGREWHTPSFPLLYGTKRRFYLSQEKIIGKDIKAIDLKQYQYVSLINAMLDLNDLIIPLTNLITDEALY